MIRRGIVTAVTVITACSFFPGSASAWGPVAHQAVLTKAIETLPGGIKDFYKVHRLELPTLALDAIPQEEGADRHFAIDHLAPFPFADVPHTEAGVKERNSEASAEVGRLPWLIQESYARLVEAFKSKDKTKILAESDVLAGLVADLHNPLALTENYDGQKSGQHGLWVRFSVRLPEVIEKSLKLSSDTAHFLDDPKEYVFSMIHATYVWVDNILYIEDLAHRSAPGYTEIYYDTLVARLGDILRARLSQAASDAGSYWYTAWTAAGRPELK